MVKRVLEAVGRIGMVLCLGLVVVGCGWLRGMSQPKPREMDEEEKERLEKAASRQLVGEVVSVHGDEGFVLIRRFGGGSLPAGFAFHAQGSMGQAASLVPTGERMGRFHAADIAGGTPRAGDLVIARRLSEEEMVPSTPTGEAKKQGFQFP